MTEAPQFSPNWVSPPGETIKDALRARGLGPSDLMRALDKEQREVSRLLSGQLVLDHDLACKLAMIVGGSVPFWLTREQMYRASLTRARHEQEEWSRHFPLRDMRNFGWLDANETSPADQTLLEYFGVRSVSEWSLRYATLEKMSAFRKSPTFDSDPNAVAAWLRQGELEASRIATDSWDPKSFVTQFDQIKALTRLKRPEHFLPRLTSICARHGVALTIVRSPTGCRASGAVRFVSADKAILQLSFRHLTDDHFWFSFFHEVGHLILHAHSRLFIEGLGDSNVEEARANQFAREVLIPPELGGELEALRPRTRDVLRFASKAGIAAGIVVGHLQHLGTLRPNQLNKLKRRFTWRDQP